MATSVQGTGGRYGTTLRIAGWTAIALLISLPLLAMQFTDQVDWTVFDFLFFGGLLTGTALAFEAIARNTAPMTGRRAYRAAAAIALAVFLLIVNGAVGIIGTEDEGANLVYAGVLATGIVGSIIARFRPAGMARTLVGMAIVQVLIAVIALIGGLGSDTDPEWPWDIVGLTASFAAAWLTSAWLFRRAAT